jgi:histidinol dehydrogenase
MKSLEAFVWNTLSIEDRARLLQRPASSRDPERERTVASILKDVRMNGDKAVLDYTKKFDTRNLSAFEVTLTEIEEATKRVSPEVIEALREASRRIRLFHEAQKPTNIKVETSPGVVCEKRFLPIERVGLYIPGGSAPLPSTLMMLAIPAKVAGCPEIFLVTPPGEDGTINDVILAAADLLGVRRIFKCGGAQAIAALAYGTETMPKVDKIFGPGNAWVTEAKMQVAFDPFGAAIDLPAGPSEVMVIADEKASAAFVASDLLSQAEHDPASQVLLVSTDADLIEGVQMELQNQLAELSRQEVASQALSSSRAILASDLREAMAIANLYAPEHLILQVENPRAAAELVRHAGSVFLGAWTPESVGDYASGTNHVLPTYGFARAFSGLGVESFMKSISFQELTEEGLKELGPTVETLAVAEGLDAHKNAVTLRLKTLAEKKS